MQKKNGISLIVLVITIIIMIILASAIIISLSNNGIIDKASEAVDKTNEKQVEELASLAWADAYAENVGKSNEGLLQALKTSVEKALSDNNLNKEDYGIEVTTIGVTIAKGWLQTSDRTVVKGSTTLKIGDYVNYVSGVEGYTDTNGWQVLGAENGELLIMSSTDVANKYFNEEKTLEGGKEAYEKGISELNEICAPYGKGAYATNARSITVEDVDRVTGYDKTQYGKGTIHEYGNIVTFLYNGTLYLSYVSINGTKGDLTYEHNNGFCWYDENGIYYNVSTSDLKSVENKDENGNWNEITKTKNTYYGYTASSRTDLKPEGETKKAYNVLFGSSNENKYWLADSFVFTDDDNFTRFGLRDLTIGGVGGYCFVGSDGHGGGTSYGVRAVVHLSYGYTPE